MRHEYGKSFFNSGFHPVHGAFLLADRAGWAADPVIP
jgi:hypothetical protein